VGGLSKYGGRPKDAAGTCVATAVRGIIGREQGLRIEQQVLPGPAADMHHLAVAFEKVHEHREALARWARGGGAARRARA